jgi:hypothetical protein
MSWAEWILSRVMPADRAAAVIGDLAEDAAARGSLWFWRCVARVGVSQLTRRGLRFGELSTGTKSGLLVGVFWILLGTGADLGVGAAAIVFGPVILLLMLMTGMTVGERTGNIRPALRTALHSGLLSGAICFIGFLAATAVFLNVMMRDPANVRDFVRHTGHLPARIELWKFLYRDALGGALNMLWISPMLTILFGGAGGVLGRAMRRNDEKQKLV